MRGAPVQRDGEWGMGMSAKGKQHREQSLELRVQDLEHRLAVLASDVLPEDKLAVMADEYAQSIAQWGERIIALQNANADLERQFAERTVALSELAAASNVMWEIWAREPVTIADEKEKESAEINAWGPFITAIEAADKVLAYTNTPPPGAASEAERAALSLNQLAIIIRLVNDYMIANDIVYGKSDFHTELIDVLARLKQAALDAPASPSGEQ